MSYEIYVLSFVFFVITDFSKVIHSNKGNVKECKNFPELDTYLEED